MQRTKNRLSAIVLAAILVVGLFPTITPPALAAPTVTAILSYQDGEFTVAPQAFAVSSGLAETYGYPNAVGADKVTVLDAIVAVLISAYGDGDINNVLVVSPAGWLNIKGSGNIGYFVNGEHTGDDLAHEIELSENDTVELVIYHDGWGMDAKAWFEQSGQKVTAINAAVGEPIELTVMGIVAFGWGDWAMPADVVDGAGIVPVEIVGGAGRFGTPLTVTDSHGEATVTFGTAGTYILSVIDADFSMDVPLISAWLVVTVTDTPSVTLTGIAVTTPPGKTVYTAGETLNLAGLVVTATYSDSSTQAITGYTSNPANGAALNTTGAVTVTVSYEGRTAAFTVTVNAAQTTPVDYETALSGTLGWIRANTTAPTVGSVGGEWAVLALARAGVKDDDWNGKYLSSLDAAIAGNSPELRNWTDYQRVTLALTALGLDAAAYKGHDMTEIFKNFVVSSGRPSNSQAFNAEIYALIALDSKPYDGQRQQFVNSILASQLAGGGWNLAGNTTMPASIDMTAMSLTALAPYYESDTNVKTAVDRALTWLDGQTAVNANELSQIIVALSALDIDAEDYVELLLTYYDAATGGFRLSASVNAMATEQAAYALVAYDRFLGGDNSLYDMSDAEGGMVILPVNKTALNGEIARAEGLTAANYISASWDAMQTALTAAKAVSANPAATQAQVDNAKTSLTAAISALVTVGGGTDTNTATISVTDPGATGSLRRIYFAAQSFTLNTGETALSLLRRTGLNVVTTGSGSNEYVVSIDGFGEFSDGALSGWMYRVNGYW
jgi:hypothetical protein